MFRWLLRLISGPSKKSNVQWKDGGQIVGMSIADARHSAKEGRRLRRVAWSDPIKFMYFNNGHYFIKSGSHIKLYTPQTDWPDYMSSDWYVSGMHKKG